MHPFSALLKIDEEEARHAAYLPRADASASIYFTGVL